MGTSNNNGQKTNGANGKDLKVVGKPFRKVDARAKCVGQTIFADDIVMPRMLYAKLLRSHEPHAIIKSIDTAKALAVPGVLAVITGKDLPIPYGILPVSQDEHTRSASSACASSVTPSRRSRRLTKTPRSTR